MKYNPIIIFAYNRPDALVSTIDAIKRNPEAKESELFIYVDGYKEENNLDKHQVLKVRSICKAINGFKSVICKFSDKNRGLGPSIISGVTEVINTYGSAIIIEDDLIVQPNFLKFMNDGLRKYENNPLVWSICGYSNSIRIPLKYKFDTYFCTRSSSWGWGTWADRWNSVDWSFNNWEEWEKKRKEFNKWGGSDCFSMLEGCKEGKNKSWAIRFCFNQFLQNKISLFPIKSLVKNEGFDGLGTNCKKYSRFKYELMPEDYLEFTFPESDIIEPQIVKSALNYHSITKRIWSRFMYMIVK